MVQKTPTVTSGRIVEESYKFSTPTEREAFKKGAAWMYYQLHPAELQSKQFNAESYTCGQLDLDSAIKHCQEVLTIVQSQEAREEHLLLCSWLWELKAFREIL